MITMAKFEITVTETCRTAYVVEADNSQEALELFEKWADHHQEWIYDDLLDGSCGWDYSTCETSPSYVADITLSSLEE